MLRLCPGCWYKLREAIANQRDGLENLIRCEPETDDGFAAMWARITLGRPITRELFDPLEVAYVKIVDEALITYGWRAIAPGEWVAGVNPCLVGWAIGMHNFRGFEDWIWIGARHALEVGQRLELVPL